MLTFVADISCLHFKLLMAAQWDAAVHKYWGDNPELIKWALKGGKSK
jgi:hypothetical protein